MIKKTIFILSISASYFVYAQDISTLKNTAEVYSNSATNGSSKYNAMAGAMGALGGDYSVLNSNPAGIAVSITNDFAGTLNIESQKNTSSFGGQSLDYKINDTDLGNVGGIAVFPLNSSSKWKFVNIGLSFSNQSIEDYTETPGNSNIGFQFNDENGNLLEDLSFAGHAYNRYGNLSKTSVGVGGNYDNRIYIGAGLNFHNSQLDQYDSAAFTNTSNASSVFDKQYTPFSEAGSGFSASVGVIGKINPNFRLGAALETPTWWTIDRIYSEYDNPTDGTYTEDRKLASPMKATISAAYVANKNFAVNVDYSLGLTKPKYKVYGDAETELNNFFDANSANLSEVKIGAEYRINAFRLRGGYGFATSPYDAVSLNSFAANGTAANSSFDNFIVGKRNTLGAGIGYDFRAFYIDAAYQHISSEFNNPFLQGSDASNTGYFSNAYVVNSDAAGVSEVQKKRNNFSVTLGWKF
ncbi:hemin receptor [Chryseobacterium sp. 6424]|uniref:OmpP1/FadL family transporter n=1 Tax=Chryseobacterium sp. 6424 TaxID=2039166 RepID=UPI000EFCFDBD|nr:hemin receptor [Chryseobacterium sp. 6424]AYO57393.1 hemin receptor [Chryseobacterium sp. 6424]